MLVGLTMRQKSVQGVSLSQGDSLKVHPATVIQNVGVRCEACLPLCFKERSQVQLHPMAYHGLHLVPLDQCSGNRSSVTLGYLRASGVARGAPGVCRSRRQPWSCPSR